MHLIQRRPLFVGAAGAGPGRSGRGRAATAGDGAAGHAARPRRPPHRRRPTPCRRPADRLTATDLEAWLDGFMPYALEQTDVAGSVVVVVKDGKVLLQKGYGFSDLAKRTPVDPERTLFRPGSVSKLFTWTAVMQLVEQGKLDLDADVNKYIDFKIPPYEGKPVTLRNIMTHTAGMEEVIRGLIANDEKEILPLDATLKHWVPERASTRRARTPAYSNYATALAGYIVAARVGPAVRPVHRAAHLRAAGHAALQLQPAAARRTCWPMTSKGYKSASDGKEQPYEYINLAPAGSLASTGADMGKFMIAHLQQRRVRRPAHPARRHRARDARHRPDLGRPAQPDDARLLRNHRQRPSRDRARRRHAVVPQRPAAVPRRRHRHLRFDQQLRQGRHRAPDPRRPGHRLRQPLPAARPSARTPRASTRRPPSSTRS